MNTIADRINHAIADLNLNARVVAKSANVAYTTWRDIESGKTEKPRNLREIAKAMGVSLDWLAEGIGPMVIDAGSPTLVSEADPSEKYEFATRVYGAVLSAGNGATHWEHEEIEGSHAFTRAWLQRKRLKIELCRVLTIEGDSMLPELRHGFVVLIDLSDCQPIKSGKVYALSVDGEQRIKRLFRQVDGSLLIRSDNPDKSHYPDEVVQPEHLDRVRIIGRKRWHAGDDD